jgi:hypothetical protein
MPSPSRRSLPPHYLSPRSLSRRSLSPPPHSIFSEVLSSMKLSSKRCSLHNSKSSRLSGGDGTDIDVDRITILCVLFHGITDVSQEAVDAQRQGLLTINTDDLSDIENLAYLAFAPTGLANIGSFNELQFWRSFLKNEMIIHIIDAITGKFNQIITATPIPETDTRPESTLSRICKYCFDFTAALLSAFQTSLANLNTLFTDFKFTGNFKVCRSVVNGLLSSGASSSVSSGGTKKRVRVSLKPVPLQRFSMNFEMFLLLLESLRLAIKQRDCTRFPEMCRQFPDPWPDYCRSAYDSASHRCRNLALLKGFGNTHMPFTNKYLSYSKEADKPLHMGIAKLNFTIGREGRVICKQTFFTPDDVIKGLRHTFNGDTYWFTMQDCIRFCTSGRGDTKTTFILDMSCSGNESGINMHVTPSYKKRKFDFPGGGSGIKKKSSSMKKTKKMKTRRRSITHPRNRRNRIKPKNKTKRK